MVLNYLSKIPGVGNLLYKLFRGLLKMYLAQEKLAEKEKQVEVLKDLVVKEAQEKYKAQEQLKQVREQSLEAVKVLTGWAVGETMNAVTSKYYLIPIKPKNKFSILLDEMSSLPPPPPTEKEDKK